MKGSCNYREAYLSTAEVSEEWHKLGQKPEVIRSAPRARACVRVACTPVILCVFEGESDKSKEKEALRVRKRERERSAYDFGSSESTSELCFSLLPLPGSPLSAVAARGSLQQGPLSVNPERNPRISSALKYTCVNIPKYQMMGISVCEWLIPCIDGGYNDSHCLCPALLSLPAHPSSLISCLFSHVAPEIPPT